MSMKTLEILGTGCSKCGKLAANTEAAAKALGIQYTLRKVTDLQEIIAKGVMMTPALLVDGVVKSFGRVPGVEEIKGLLL
jgi:small redox-active disulfide protein 2